MLKTNKQSGFTIVELMIAMVMSTLLIAGLISFFSSTVGSTSTTTGNIQMSQDFQTAMSFISDEVRNTGYWKNSISSDATTNPFGLRYPDADNTSSNCIVYSFDADPVNGSIDNSEKRAIRLNTTTNAIEYLENTTDTSCPDADWTDAEQLTDKNKIKVTALTFTLEETCYNSTDQATYDCTVSQTNGDLLIGVQNVYIKMDGELIANDKIKRHIERKITLRNTVTREG